MRFDAHTHVFRDGLELRAGRRYTPTTAATPERLATVLAEHGLLGALLVQPSFLAHHDYAFAAADADPQRFRVVTAPTTLAELAEHWPQWLERGVVGVRLNLVGAQVPDLGAAGWRAMGHALADRGVHLEVHARQQQWDELLPALASWPSHVVIDHLGRHSSPQALADVGALEHVWFKVSAPYRWPDRDAGLRLVRDLLDTTGGARLLWGSDWPFTQHDSVTYDAMLDVVTRELPEVAASSDANLQRLLGRRAFPTPD